MHPDIYPGTGCTTEPTRVLDIYSGIYPGMTNIFRIGTRVPQTPREYLYTTYPTPTHLLVDCAAAAEHIFL